MHGDVVLGAAVLGDRKRNPLLRLEGERSAPELGPHPGVSPQGCGGSGKHADEVVELPTAREGALQDRRARVRGGQLVVDVKSRDLGHFSGHFFTFATLLTKMILLTKMPITYDA